MVNLKSMDTWKVKVEAAKIRSYATVLQLSESKSCYQIFTMKNLLKRIKKKSEDQRADEKENQEELKSLIDRSQSYLTDTDMLRFIGFKVVICWFYYTSRYLHHLWQEKQICQEKARTFKTMRGETNTENIGKVCKWKWFSHAVAIHNHGYDCCLSKISSFMLCRVYPPEKSETNTEPRSNGIQTLWTRSLSNRRCKLSQNDL